CADVEVNVPAPAVPHTPRPRAAPPAEVEVPDVPEAPPTPVVRHRPPPTPAAAPPPVVIYQPVPPAPPPQAIVVTPGDRYRHGPAPVSAPGAACPPARPPPPMITAPHAVPRWQPEFGMNLRVEGMGINKPGGSTFSAGLGGVGLSLRYRPNPHFAFDMGVDVL